MEIKKTRVFFHFTSIYFDSLRRKILGLDNRSASRGKNSKGLLGILLVHPEISLSINVDVKFH